MTTTTDGSTPMVLEALTELQATVATQQNLLVTDYLRREDADVLYAPMDTDGGGTGATTGGLTKTEADTYYQPIGDYAPLTGSSEYATKSEIPDITGKAPLTNPENGQNNYAGRDYVDNQLALLGGGGSSTLLYLTSPNKATWNPTVPVGWYSWFNWQVRQNTTPFTMLGGPRLAGKPGSNQGFTDVPSDMEPDLPNTIQNRTTKTYLLRVHWQLGSTMMCTGTGTDSLAMTWMQQLTNVPISSSGIYDHTLTRVKEANINYAVHNSDYRSLSFDSTYSYYHSPTMTTLTNFPAVSSRARGFTRTKGAYPYHSGSAIFPFGPGDTLAFNFIIRGASSSAGTYDHTFFNHLDVTNFTLPLMDGYINEWRIEAIEL